MCDVTDNTNDVMVMQPLAGQLCRQKPDETRKCQFCHKALSSHIDESKPQTNFINNSVLDSRFYNLLREVCVYLYLGNVHHRILIVSKPRPTLV